jgi:LPXTG-motif cell wall-anchored protein
MSVRRTVAQYSAGVLLLSAFAVGPSVAFGETAPAPGGPSDGGGAESSQDQSGDFDTRISLSADAVPAGKAVDLTVHCFPGPERGTAEVTVVGPNGFEEPLVPQDAPPGGTGVWQFTVPDNATEDDQYSFVVKIGKWNNNVTLSVSEGADEDGDDDQGDEGQGSGDQGEGNQGDGDQGGDGEDGGGDQGTDDDGSENGADSGSDDQTQDDGDGSGDGSQQGDAQEDDGANGTGSEAGSGAGSDSGDDTDADAERDPAPSAGGDRGAASRPAPQQPPAAPGSATNDFPAATPEATADQEQSAALAVLMTSLFAHGVSSGQVGTSPDEARTVIDPSAEASEIGTPAGDAADALGASDAGAAGEDGTGSASADDELAATGTNTLVPAAIAGLALLGGIGLLRLQRRHRD